MRPSCQDVRDSGALAPGLRHAIEPDRLTALDAHVAACAGCTRDQALVEAGLSGGPGPYAALVHLRSRAETLDLTIPGFGEDEDDAMGREAGETATLAEAADGVVLPFPPSGAVPRGGGGGARRWAVVAGMLAAAVGLFAVLSPDLSTLRGGWRGDPAPTIVLVTRSEGGDTPVRDVVRVGEVVVVSGEGAPGQTLSGWVALGGEPLRPLGTAVVGEDGTFGFAQAERVGGRGVLTVVVTTRADAPPRDGGGELACGAPACVHATVRVR